MPLQNESARSVYPTTSCTQNPHSYNIHCDCNTRVQCLIQDFNKECGWKSQLAKFVHWLCQLLLWKLFTLKTSEVWVLFFISLWFDDATVNETVGWNILHNITECKRERRVSSHLFHPFQLSPACSCKITGMFLINYNVYQQSLSSDCYWPINVVSG